VNGGQMNKNIDLLMVEDSEDDAELLLRALQHGGLNPQHERVQTADAMRKALTSQRWDLIISDFSMPYFDGNSAYALLKDSGKDIPFMFVSGTLGEETAVEAMRLGVSDYFVKGNLNRLVPAIRRELEKAEDRRMRKHAEEALQRAEQELRQAQKMEAMGRLAAGVAHDFNNLLTVVVGYTEMLSDGSKRSSEDLRLGLTEIRKCAERGSALTRQLLAFGRHQPLQRRPVDLNRVVSEFGSMLRRLIGDEIALEFRLAEGLSKVMVDPNQMEQIVMNLVLNSRDAMRGGGQILIETGERELTALELAANSDLKPGRFAMLTVKDNGHGMSEAVIQKIFEPFFTTKAPGQGSGMGLSTVYGIVKQSGGHLSVESEVDRGTSFRVYLPFTEEIVEEKRPADASASNTITATETVLVVEDTEALRYLVQVLLTRSGYHVIQAPTGEDALAMIETYSGTIDLLLTDLTMPKMNGRELVRIVQVKRPEIRVLCMTGYVQPEVIQEMEDSKIDYIMKPFNAVTLGKKIREVLQKPKR